MPEAPDVFKFNSFISESLFVFKILSADIPLHFQPDLLIENNNYTKDVRNMLRMLIFNPPDL